MATERTTIIRHDSAAAFKFPSDANDLNASSENYLEDECSPYSLTDPFVRRAECAEAEEQDGNAAESSGPGVDFAVGEPDLLHMVMF